MDFSRIRAGLMQPSVWALLGANLVTALGVVFLHWSQAAILLLFWAESAVIGFYTVLKLLLAKPEKFEGGKTLAGRLLVTGVFVVFTAVRLVSLLFFIVHFGIFMFVHLMFLVFFLVSEADPQGVLSGVALGGAAYFLSHGYSFVVNFLNRKDAKAAEPKSLMLAPYPRIILMQFALILGAFLGLPALLLVVGKTVFDAASHLFEHGWLVARSPAGSEI